VSFILKLAVVVDEEPQVRSAAVRLLEHAGFAAEAFPDFRAAAPSVMGEGVELLLVSSTSAGREAAEIAAARRANPRLLVLLTCPQGLDCPVHKGLRCLKLDCIRKPFDFVPGRFAARLNAARQAQFRAKPALPAAQPAA
jgi:DNA-binding response OmpR family regulator